MLDRLLDQRDAVCHASSDTEHRLSAEDWTSVAGLATTLRPLSVAVADSLSGVTYPLLSSVVPTLEKLRRGGPWTLDADGGPPCELGDLRRGGPWTLDADGGPPCELGDLLARATDECFQSAFDDDEIVAATVLGQCASVTVLLEIYESVRVA